MKQRWIWWSRISNQSTNRPACVTPALQLTPSALTSEVMPSATTTSSWTTILRYSGWCRMLVKSCATSPKQRAISSLPRATPHLGKYTSASSANSASTSPPRSKRLKYSMTTDFICSGVIVCVEMAISVPSPVLGDCASGERDPQVLRLGRRELAVIGATVQLLGARSCAPGGDELLWIDVGADRVLCEALAVHELRRTRPVAEVIDLQLHAVAVRVGVVERQRHPVIEDGVREHAAVSEPDVRAQELVERLVLERGVMDARVDQLVGVVANPRRRQQREAMVGRIVAQPGSAGEGVGRSHPHDQPVPVDHLPEPPRLEVDVMQPRHGDGVGERRPTG